jgi:hypothetical protein
VGGSFVCLMNLESPLQRASCSTGVILDTLNRHDSRQLCGRFARFGEPLTRRSEPTKTDVEVAKAHDMVASLQFGNADELVDKRFTDEDKLILPPDLAGGAYTANLMVGIIPWVLDTTGRARGEGV